MAFSLATVGDSSIRIIVACLILIAAIIILCLIIWYYRRKLLSFGDNASDPWTLDEVQRLYEKGDITQEEYQAMRKAIIDTFRGQGSVSKESTSPGSLHDLTDRE